MKKLLIAVVFIATVLVAFVGCAHVVVTDNISITNNTGVIIRDVYVREAGSVAWGNVVNIQQRTRPLADGSRVIVTDQHGAAIWDRFDIAAGRSAQIRVSRRGDQRRDARFVDVKVIDANGIIYGKYNVILTTTEGSTFTPADMHPVLTMQNNTGFPIRVSTPRVIDIPIGSSGIYQMPELIQNRRHTVTYTIAPGNYAFTREVTLDTHQTMNLTERPPVMSVQNNTGYPIRILSPWQETVANEASSRRHPKASRNDQPRHTIRYQSGTFMYEREVVLEGNDVILTLGVDDRPPIVTIQNNTGNTVNLVFTRHNGAMDWGHNIIGIPLNEFGIVGDIPVGTAADVRRGSFTNRESFRFWLGSLPANNALRYDIRIDDVNGSPYVKNNQHITRDVTLTFTTGDRP